MERQEEWRGVGTALPTVTRKLAGMFIVQTTNQRLVAAFAHREDYKTAIDEHNQHTTLVEQRDRYLQALEETRSTLGGLRNHLRPGEDSRAKDYVDYMVKRIDHTLATVEQGHEEQAGSGSEG